MPNILLHACDMDKQIQHITCNVDVYMKKELYKDFPKAYRKLEQLSEELGEVIKKYFPDYEETLNVYPSRKPI